MHTVRLGMIGCGEIAVRTAEGIAEAPHAAHVMVMDARLSVAADMGERYNVPHTDQVETLLANPDVDAVYIAVPHYLHAPLTVQALDAKKHVLCEKPIATTLADADAMIRAAEKNARKLSIAYGAQVDASHIWLHDALADGLIGRITGTRIVARADKPESYWHGGYSGRVQTDWRISKEKAGGGVLIMNTIHDLNTIRYLTGLEVTRVYAEYDTFVTDVEVEDFIAVTFRYDNGAIGSLEAGSAVRGREPAGRAHNRIYGERGQLVLSPTPQLFLTEPYEQLPAGQWIELSQQTEAGALGPRATMVDRFAAAVLTDTEPPVTGWDGRAALEIALTAYRSGQLQQPVTLPLAASGAAGIR